VDTINRLGLLEDYQKRVHKEYRENYSALLSEFKKESRLMQKEELSILKYEEKKSKEQISTLPKKEKEVAKKTAKTELDQHQKLFSIRQDLRTSRFTCDCRAHGLIDLDTAKWKFHHFVQQENERNMQEIVNLKKKHAEKEYQLNVQAAEELLSVHTDNIQQMHPLELSNLKQIHEKEMEHLGKQQFVETKQQQDLLASDHKSQLRDFNAQKQADEKRLIATIKDYKKDNRKKFSKAQLEAYGVQQKNIWDAEWNEKLEAFKKEQKEQKDEEESLLKAHHATQTERLKIQCEEQIQALVTAYENEKIDLTTKFQENIGKLEHFYWTTLLEFTKISNKTKKEMAVENFEAEKVLVQSINAEHKKLHESFNDEFRQIGSNNAEIPQQQIEDFMLSLNSFAFEMMKIFEQQAICLAVIHEEELDEIEDSNAREEKMILSKAPPGVFT